MRGTSMSRSIASKLLAALMGLILDMSIAYAIGHYALVFLSDMLVWASLDDPILSCEHTGASVESSHLH
jgi:hypothetical protein